MALSFCYAYPWISTKFHCVSLLHGHRPKSGLDARFPHSPQSFSTELFGKHVLGAEVKQDWSFMGGHRIAIRPKIDRCINLWKSSGVCHSCKPPLSEMTRLAGLSNSQIASSVFTLGTAAVLPFYTLMLAAPKAELTKKTMRSSLPYVALGLLYGYLLCLSWTPDTIRLMFASKYWLPELQGIAKMFSSEMTLASAWIHLLVVDLFAARQVYHDGLENEVETRHSVAMCLLFCPIGIISHAITKGMTNTSEKTKHNDSPI